MTTEELLKLLVPLHWRLRLRSPAAQEEIIAWGQARTELRLRAGSRKSHHWSQRPLTAFLVWAEDEEAGYPEQVATVTVEGIDLYDDDGVREHVREALERLGGALEGDTPTGVYFECEECGAREDECTHEEVTR